MIIKLQKPTCPECTSDNIYIHSSRDHFECNDCGYDEQIIYIFEDEQTFCNCDLCKKLMIDKSDQKE